MAKCRAIFFASAFAAFFCFSLAPSNISATPSKQCLQCICEASSGCKPNIRCHNTGNGQYFCGPYQISWAYWADAGKPGSTGFSNDFENCLIDKNCAEAAVRGYMAKWGADCDGNGQVDCFDYAAIHKTGPGGCQQQWLLNSKYWSDFKQCYTGSNVNSNRQVFSPLQPQPPRAAISSSVPLSNSQPSFSSSSSSFRAIPIGGGGNSGDTIIEIPKPLVSRPPGRHSSAISSSSSSTAFASPSGPAFASFSSSSSFSRHNSHTEVEISESESSSSNTVSSSTNRVVPPPLSSVTTTTTHYTPLRPSPPLQPSFPPVAASAPAPVPSITFSSSSSLPSYPAAPSSPPQSNPSRPTTLFQTLPRPPSNFNPIVPADCLECLCQASSKCAKTGCEGAYCGPFLLSWGYWADSGSPGNGANYPSCANNRSCAELAVHGYMNKWNKDCDNDGQITCNDFALIHKLGPHACGKTEAIKDTDYWRRYETCRGEETSGNDSPVVISSVGSNALQPDSAVSTPNRFAWQPPQPPPKPETEVEDTPSSPTLVDQPLSRPAPLAASSSPEVRISFNNREIVNIHGNSNRPLSPQPTSYVPPATVHSRPLEAEQPLPRPVSNADDNLPAIPETNDNLNVISNSPLARANPLPAASLYNPGNARNQPPAVPSYKPLPPTEAPFVEVRPSSNTDYYDNPRDNSGASSSSPAAAAQPSLSSQPSEQPTRSDILARSVGSSNSSAVSNSVVPQDCLECICHASSRCNNNAGCVSDGSGKFICGPYQVDWEYWTEAGKPGQRSDLSNLENFQQCLTNRQCADETVRGYMTRFLKDCDENGVRDCSDMAAIHIAGPRNCNAQWYLDSQYYADFRSCYDFRRRK